MLPDVRPSRALILGLGGGTIALLLMRRFGSIPIVGVEIEPQVIRLARSAFGLDLPNVEILEGDALQYVLQAEGRFDYVAVDLFAGDVIPSEIFAKPFLRAVRRLLNPGGLAAFNFFKDRRTPARQRRLAEVFPRVVLADSGKNVVAVCRPR